MSEVETRPPIVQVQQYSIGELAREFSITLRTIRFYEDQGLIKPDRDGLTRIFSQRDKDRLALICRSKRLGFSIRTIKNFLDLYDREDKRLERRKYALEKIDERITHLQQQRIDIEETLSELYVIKAELTAELQNGTTV